MVKTVFLCIVVTALFAHTSTMAKDKVVVIPLFKSCSGVNDLTKCSGQYVDLMNNPDACGDCTTACATDSVCIQGECKNQIGSECDETTGCISGRCLDNVCRTEKLVFFSSVYYQANLGGLDGADEKCNLLATNAGLPGTYKAWLSDSTGSPATRFVRSYAYYVTLHGDLVASSWEDLTDGQLSHNINVNENNIVTDGIWVWTGTGTDGAISSLAAEDGDCASWTSASYFDRGSVGGATVYTNEYWTNAMYLPCEVSVPLLCFQQ